MTLMKPDELSELNAWPDCAVRGCSNKSCISLDSKYCWPHSPGTPEQARVNLLETEIVKKPAMVVDNMPLALP